MDNIPSTVYQMVNNMKSLYADDVAVRYYDEKEKVVQSVKYAQVYEDICRCAAFLKKELPGERPHVAILARNCYHYIVHIFAIILADMVAVPLNIQKDPDELFYETELADVTAIVHDGTYLEGEPTFAECSTCRFIPMDAFTGTLLLIPAETADPDALAMIQFTSGTTAKSKGVMVSQNNLFAATPANVASQLYIENQLGLSGRRLGTSVMLPMYHAVGFIPFISGFSCGQSINLSTDPRRFYRDIAAMPSDFTTLVPVMLEMIHRDVMQGKDRFGQLRAIATGAAAADPRLLQDLCDKGFMLFQGYGMTETAGGTVALNRLSDSGRTDSIGKPTEGVECKLENGELCVRGKAVMLGYCKDPAATAEVIDREGWLHTGDLARIDDEGFIYLTGRKKNLIILSSGENINPEELEEILYKNPVITETVVAEQNGKICARVYCPENVREAVQAYIDDLNRTLPMYKHISAVEFRSAPFERTATGKIKRN